MKLPVKKKPLMFGEFITSVYDACDRQKARGRVRLAVNARLFEFRGQRRFVTSSPE